MKRMWPLRLIAASTMLLLIPLTMVSMVNANPVFGPDPLVFDTAIGDGSGNVVIDQVVYTRTMIRSSNDVLAESNTDAALIRSHSELIALPEFSNIDDDEGYGYPAVQLHSIESIGGGSPGFSIRM